MIAGKGTSFGAGKQPLTKFIAVAVPAVVEAKLYPTIVT
jgi:hypothetical protein